MRGSGSSWRAATGRGAGAGLLLRALAGVPLRAAENSPMATGATEKGVKHAPSLIQAADGPAACYRELSRFPAVTRAALRAAAGGQTFLLYTECSRPDLARRRLLRFGRHYSLRRTAGREGLAVSRTALSAEIHNQLLSQDSPTGQRRALLKRCPRQGHELLEVWDSGGCSHSVDLTAVGKHGEVYTEGPFACLAWSHSETRLLYVAEKSQPKRQPPCPWDVPGAAWPAAEDEDEEGKQFVYHEDWGETLSTRSEPILCILDLESLSLSVLEGVPEHLSPGQALWSPNDHGVVFVGWWHKPFRLGLNACSNRRSGIFHLDLASGCCELLSAENGSACSPQLSPDGQRLLYLEGVVGGPHRQCLCLRMVTWQTRQTVTVLDVVQEPTEAFAGLYAEVLPPRCWAADSRRAVLGTPQRSRTDLLLVDTEAATVTNLTAGSPEGCWELLTLQWDLLVATCSAPHHPPSLVVAVLPPAGQELSLDWVPVEDTPTVPGVTWKTLTVQPPCSRQGPAAQDTQAFEALLLSPSDGTPPHPLVVCPHGGPHAVFDARWRPSMAALCRLGFAVLLVNYRGSLGFGQASISSLLSHVGEQDVADTQVRGAGLGVLGDVPGRMLMFGCRWWVPHGCSWQWSRRCTESPWTRTAWPCWLAPTEPSSPSTSSLASLSVTKPVPCAAPSPTCPHCWAPLTSLTGATPPWGCPTPSSECHVLRRWPPCYCAHPSPKQPRCRRQCCCAWAPGTGASAPCRRWSCTGCCGPEVCQHGCCGTRRVATHWLVWRRRPMSSQTVPTGSSSTWGSPDRMGRAGTGPSAHSGPGLCQPQGDCWPWGPHQDQRQMERV
ncbi:acylamino-acid-releasing enzyme-like isoform X1 [Corvus moneduloides]|uniref:acylamino-acid-releasing enzyme-like isoform X1 n=1 Tax=Corvus moneduloides TaxID=1196302 RepID=UPI001362B3FE|nr:acylamino-acid-releasing enzyme-like isoform X1 [Corvus moneduloides]